MNFWQEAALVLHQGLANQSVTKAVKKLPQPGMKLLVDNNLNNNKIQSVFGNRCGHSPQWPRIATMPVHHKKRFPIIERAIKNVNKTFFLPLALPFGKVYFHNDKPTKRGRNRKVRSEMREAIACKVTMAILHHNNLDKMQLGYFKGGHFISYGLKYLQKILHISSIQLRRAMKILKSNGYIFIEERRFQRPDKSYGSLQSIIKVSPKLYLDLGVTEEELFKTKKKEVKTFEHKQTPVPVNENPGRERRREENPLYRDYTGVATHKPRTHTNTCHNPLRSIRDILNSS